MSEGNLIVQKDELTSWVKATMEEIKESDLVTHDCVCPHCKYPIRFPAIARASDLKAFETMINSASQVMEEWGITGKLLATIRAKCHIAIANRKAKSP